eukprot:CAMPEP_0168316100 /NCGR_PEP_ID=MMETSP0210-20121227/14306_1 /TAXON_ID=40633 /ORGANISM="Condylostoma magnum, Strain COL2" /LENGTH=151 /DNA_ID=CAMNT_0008294725 /DNA_START=2062 /DNA_END=2517 /DNA_ORIENTATION=-
MGVTETHQGITNQDVILVLTSGEVYSLSKRFLSPRRKGEEATDISEWDEPSLPAYKPVVPLVSTKVLNYYSKLEGLSEVKSTFTMLESTSLVAVYGLDLFVVRVMPEKSFDMLTEEYNFKAVIMTILGLFSAIVVAYYYMAGQKVKKYFSE